MCIFNIFNIFLLANNTKKLNIKIIMSAYTYTHKKNNLINVI